MAKRTISFADYEEPTWEEYTGEDPPAGKWFNAALTKVKFLKEDDQLMFIFEITEGDFKGWGKSIYAPFEGERKFAMHQTLKAVQGGKMTDVTVDWENEKAVAAWVAKQKPVKLKTREYNNSILIAKVAPLLEGLPSEKPATKASPLAAEPEPVEDDAPVEDYSEEELAEMETAELEEILAEEFEVAKDSDEWPELTARQKRADKDGSKYKDALIEAILTEQESDEGDDPAEGDDVEEGDEGFEDGFNEDADEEPEPEPEPAPRARRSRAAAAPAKAAPAPAKATTTRRRRA
jgi:hypothetical protein